MRSLDECSLGTTLTGMLCMLGKRSCLKEGEKWPKSISSRHLVPEEGTMQVIFDEVV